MANAKYHNHEYGFPSTHTTTAVAYVLYFYSFMARSDLTWSFPVKGLIYVGLALYAVLIAFGRVYCGMHSITDCVGGAAIGIAVWGIYTYFSETIAYYFTVGFWWTPLAVLAILVLSQVCFPVPIEDCPCSDDSAVCIPTTAGMVLGTVHFASMAYSSNVPEPGTIPYSSELGAVKSILRFVIGVVVVFTWRILAKKVAAWAVPPIYRVLCGGNDKQSVIMEERLHETSLSLEASLDQDYAVVSSLHMADDWIKDQAIRNRQQASSPLLSSSPLPESGTEVSSFESSETEVERDDQSFAKDKAATPSLSKTHQHPHGPLHHWGGLGPEYLTKMFVYTSLGYTLTCLVPVLFAVFGLSVPPSRV
ncbi:hypothetical protein BGW42_005023 [Actinomortierella wolfii]|nr:hypothetical protein BGW42_005023 [Actinomortierella wolfii]